MIWYGISGVALAVLGFLVGWLWVRRKHNAIYRDMTRHVAEMTAAFEETSERSNRLAAVLGQIDEDVVDAAWLRVDGEDDVDPERDALLMELGDDVLRGYEPAEGGEG